MSTRAPKVPPPDLPPLDTVEQLEARLAEIAQRKKAGPAGAAEPSDERQRLRERVVLLDYFAARWLEAPEQSVRRSGPAAGDDTVHEFVTKDCDLVTAEGDAAWRLRLDVRRETLERLGLRGVRQLATSPDGIPAGKDDIAHSMALRLLQPDIALQRLSPMQLSGVLRAREWLSGLQLTLPTEPEVLRALDLANVLEPLRAVARIDFVGRQAELSKLEDFAASQDSSQPFGLYGPGGIGKSTLIARFVLRHVEGDADPLPFAYLTFDRADLDPQFPLTLIAEVCRQLALQAPQSAQQLASVQQAVMGVLRAQKSLRDELSGSRGTATRDVLRYDDDGEKILVGLAAAMRAAFGSRPLLLVLDTFEVAQSRDRSGLTRLRSTLMNMSRLTSVRIVVAGRAEPIDLTSRIHPLDGLSGLDSISLLRNALGPMRVSREMLSDVAARVSGNPLSLRLAADLMVREGESALATARGRRRFLFGLREDQIQGVLYRRILDHLDRRVQPLANPGLVVRLITADVIATVLAQPCGLGKVGPRQARELYELLRTEASLVREVRPGVLAHRSDVRAQVLPLLESDDPQRVAAIHRLAARYYLARVEAEAHIDDQTEHLYHLLMPASPAPPSTSTGSRQSVRSLRATWRSCLRRRGSTSPASSAPRSTPRTSPPPTTLPGCGRRSPRAASCSMPECLARHWISSDAARSSTGSDVGSSMPTSPSCGSRRWLPLVGTPQRCRRHRRPSTRLTSEGSWPTTSSSGSLRAGWPRTTATFGVLATTSTRPTPRPATSGWAGPCSALVSACCA
ncbi:MAG: AAA family ATPase [Dermatophilaceae bacterium]